MPGELYFFPSEEVDAISLGDESIEEIEDAGAGADCGRNSINSSRVSKRAETLAEATVPNSNAKSEESGFTFSDPGK